MLAFIGTSEIVIILIIALLVFGPTKLPEIGRQIAGAMREVNRMRNDVQRAFDLDDHRYESRYEPSSYYTENSSTWTAENGQEAGDGAGETYGEPVEGTHAWSAVNDAGPGGSGDYESRTDHESQMHADTQGLFLETHEPPAPVVTLEPPGPPRRHEEA